VMVAGVVVVTVVDDVVTVAPVLMVVEDVVVATMGLVVGDPVGFKVTGDLLGGLLGDLLGDLVEVTGLDDGASLGERVGETNSIGLEVGTEVDNGDLLGDFVSLIGLDVGDADGVAVGTAVSEATGDEVGSCDATPPELHPAVLLTSPTTASLHAPFVSCCATQKKAPPLHSNSPSLISFRS